MSVYEGTIEGGSSRDSRRSRRPGRWRPLEIAAMVVGFMVYWPIGIAIVLAKVWQRREGHSGDLVSFAQEKVMPNMQSRWNCATRRNGWAAEWQRGFASTGFGGAGFGMRSTGNSAFDSWRSAELGRLEEERRKLAAAEREFAEHLDRLRQARDREEFDRFMAERNARTNPPAGPDSPAA